VTGRLRTLLLGLIGAGIDASRSPAMHEEEGAAHGLRCIYQRIDLADLGLNAEALPELLTAAERMGFAGLNITHPCKQDVVPLLTDLSGEARAIGAVNTVGMVANYQQNSAPIYTLMAANLQPASPPYFVPSTGTGHDGFTIGASSISGIGVFDTNPLSLTYGTAFDFSFGLLAYAMPRDGSASSTFSSTALLTGIDVFDALGNPVNDFSILSESGTVYDASGVHLAPSVPEPNTLALLATGMICLFGRELVRRRKAGSLQPIA
jgi:hypothetical protein